MYELCLQKAFRARHALIGGDWGAENQPHAHDYRLEWRLRSEVLDAHGYVADLVHLEARLEEVLARYREQFLNELPEFQGLNPSLERFAQVLYDRLSRGEAFQGLSASLRLWEHGEAWAEYRP